jgi:recombination protein RecA
MAAKLKPTKSKPKKPAPTPDPGKKARFSKTPLPGAKKTTAAAKKRKDDALAAVLVRLRKKYGATTVTTLHKDPLPVPCISTGFQELDDVLSGAINSDGDTVTGSGSGLPVGRITEVFGPEAAGKTTFTLEVVAAYQEQGYTCAFVDAEHALDPIYAKRIGVDFQKLLLSQPNSAEEVGDIVSNLVDAEIDLIVVDSVAAMTPMAEQEKDMDEVQVALQARLVSKLLRKITSKGSKSQVIFINQLRDKIGAFGFGPKTTTPGGKALKFYASHRIDIRRVKTLKKKSKFHGIRSNIKVVKNKIASPFREIFVEMTKGLGITKVDAVHTTEEQPDEFDA